jgi:hypothetical protein
MTTKTPSESLAEVLRLSELATAGPWLDHGFHDDGIDGERIVAQHVTEAMGYAVASVLPCGVPDDNPSLTEANAQFIAAAVNFIRNHAAKYAEMERDADRYRWLRDRLSGRDHIMGLVEYNHNFHTELRSEVDTAIDAAIAAQDTAQGGSHET